jgi:adenosylcobinamide-phosphate synthase
VALQLIAPLAPDPFALAAAVLLDLALGDPVYRWHPVRLIGATLAAAESALRRSGATGYAGGILLFVALGAVWVGGVCGAVLLAARMSDLAGLLVHTFFLYSLLALGDLLRHVWRVERAVGSGDLPAARRAIGLLVGRDTEPMDAAACRRAALESLSENLTDGFVSPLFWYVVAGLPGLVLFKVVSTMDSMVGYRSERYLRFGWCGARLDDVMNYVPARLTWLLIAALAAVIPQCSASKALTVGFRQHAVLPGPNSGWSEAAAAGALQRRLVGPIWVNGQLVTDRWLGDAADRPAATHEDVVRGLTLVGVTGVAAVALAVVTMIVVTSTLP